MKEILHKTASLPVLAFAIFSLGLSACADQQGTSAPTPSTAVSSASEAGADTASQTPIAAEAAAEKEPQAEKEPTVQEAKEFLEDAEIKITKLSEYVARVYWVNSNFITEDTDWLAAKAGAESSVLSTSLANQAKRYNDLNLPADMARKMDGLKRGSNFPAPEKDGAAAELAGITTWLGSTYGKGKFNHDGEEINLIQASNIIAKSRDPEELRAVWEGWRTISPPMKDAYKRMVEIINEGSNELGFDDTGALWRSGYDMPADDFTAETERLFAQVKPLYEQLHCSVRAALNETHGDDVQPLHAPIRADLLGNMWGQSWGNVYDLVAPEGSAQGVDITKLLEEKGYDQIQMVKTGEAFFTSMGFDPLPETFWKRSLITKPADRDVRCHASAWDIDDREDIRIKMCTQVNGEDFSTIHHELGHNIYQRAYMHQPVFYKDGANDGFHEAIGDMIALSITPEYLVKIGLLDAENVPGEEADIALLLRQAMDKVAFVPFGLMVDQWRWKVFSGELSPSEYNSGWWELRDKYQGLRAPNTRPDDAFDPGAKYHIPGNTPYMRYFLSHILQFQFHRAACDMAGFEGPLHRCSIYGNKDVGAKFNDMLEMGASKPWPDALEAFTGQRDMDATALLEYFAPLMTYLEAQNKDRTCGW